MTLLTYPATGKIVNVKQNVQHTNLSCHNFYANRPSPDKFRNRLKMYKPVSQSQTR